MVKKQAENIVNEILDELRGRRGFRHLLDEIQADHEVYAEMYAALVERVDIGTASDNEPSSSYFYPQVTP